MAAYACKSLYFGLKQEVHQELKASLGYTDPGLTVFLRTGGMAYLVGSVWLACTAQKPWLLSLALHTLGVVVDSCSVSRDPRDYLKKQNSLAGKIA